MPRPRGMGMGVPSKSKNFGAAIKRLFKELTSFRLLIGTALTLAMIGSVLSIIAPNKLSKLTDTIAEGLVVNKDNMLLITDEVSNNFTNIDPSLVMNSSNLTVLEKQAFMELMSTIDVNDKVEMLNGLANLSENTLNELLPQIEVDGNKISSFEQIEYLKILSELSDDATPSEIYQKIDAMPEVIQKVIKPFMDMDKIKKIALFMAGLYICSALFNYIQSFIMSTVSNNFAKQLRGKISKKINKLPLKYFDHNQTGDTLSRVTNDVDTISQSMNQSLASLISAITLFVGTVIMMFYTNWILAITTILSSLLGFAFMVIILGKSQKYFTARQVELGKLNSHIEEVYSGLIVVKAYNGKKEADKKFDECNKKVFEANRKSRFLSGLMMPMMSFVGDFGYVAVCVVGAILTQKEIITFGVIVAFITYVRLFTQPLSQMAQAFTSLQSTAAASERVFEFLDEKEMDNQENISKLLDKSKVLGNIEFSNVQFGYDDDKLIIKDFTVKVHDGQKIAIVGPTGAGKTTMVNLLMKFYEINSGDILIDGISSKELSRENIHKLFTMVLQDTWLFNGTLRENIVYNRENISDEKIMEVCNIVGLTHFVKTLPNGLDTEISENDSVSAGQKQLITIARGMIEDAPFLILDEATSNVDTRTEELVQKAMDKLTEGRTSFIIAHRLSTIKNADLILVMKDGNIIEQGNHNELMKQGGFYADLYNSQFEL